MKKHITIYLVFLFAGITNINAQDYFSFYNLDDYVIQTQNLSPVFIPKNRLTIAIPGANAGLNFNSGFKINELLVKNETTNKLEFDLVNLYETADKINEMNIDVSINLFYVAFKRKKGSITIFANTRATNNWRYTKDFLGITANGINQDFTLNEQNEYTGYNEFGVGFTQTFFDDRLAVAIRAKYLNGFIHSSTEDGAQLSLEIDDPTGYYTIIAEKATVNSAGLNSFSGNGEEFKIFTDNTGFGFDFGATFNATKKLTFEIAINDVGSITWNEDVQNFRIADTGTEGVLYTGIDLRTETELGKETLDQLGSIANSSETSDSFKTELNMKTYLSARYAITEKNTLTLVAFNTHAFDDFKPSYSLGYNRTLSKTTFGALASIGGINNEFLLGANFAVNLGPLQIYAATDSLKAIFAKPEEATGLNLRIGLNLVFGYK
ncbi:DUF5723 family protein [Flavicella sp.]|uniref:DUF5723 family protein n=1 Tax=Flavicella sp. TaxID=2957742 RepID=UPI00301A2A2C